MAMIRGRCPICSRRFEIETLDDLPSFPFCSDRCKLVDLGRWIDGSYTIPDTTAPPAPGESPEAPGGSETEGEAPDELD